MEGFMMLTAGTRLYNWWLQTLGAKVASDAMVLAPLGSFDLISIGSQALVDKDVSLSTCRLLPCSAPYNFAERHTKVNIGARAALAEASAVVAADVGESSICAEGTVVGPDVALPPRSFVSGSTATRYRWNQGNFPQLLETSELFAPPLENDTKLSMRFVSELHKSQRKIRSQQRPIHTLEAAFVTGAAGFLARFVVSELLQDSEEPLVYCMVRGRDEESARKKLLEAMERAGLTPTAKQMQRLYVVNADLTKPHLGLEPARYLQLAATATHIFHVAARVNHAEPYHMLFQDNVTGTMQMLEFAATARVKHFHYVSTIGTLSPDMSSCNGSFKESTRLKNLRMGNVSGTCELAGGYTYSKWVAEKLCFAAFKMGLPGTISRPGLIGGSSQLGVCGEDNFVQLLCDMVKMGTAPRLLGNQFNITPPDFIAHGLLKAVVRQPFSQWNGKVFHPIARGSNLDMPTIVAVLAEAGYPLKLVDFQEFRSDIQQRFAESLTSSQGAQFKSGMFMSILTAEAHGLDALASVDQAWKSMESAPAAVNFSAASLLRGMIEYLVATGRLQPSSRQSEETATSGPEFV